MISCGRHVTSTPPKSKMTLRTLTLRDATGRDRVELAGLVVVDRLRDLLASVHDERTVRDDGRADRLGVTEQQHGSAARLDLDGIAVLVELDEVPFGYVLASYGNGTAND